MTTVQDLINKLSTMEGTLPVFLLNLQDDGDGDGTVPLNEIVDIGKETMFDMGKSTSVHAVDLKKSTYSMDAVVIMFK